jgi:hypothetical protein
MTTLRSNSYTNLNGCRFFFSYASQPKTDFLFKRNFIQLKPTTVEKGQVNLNLLCFPKSNQASTFESIFTRLYENYLKHIIDYSHLNFYNDIEPERLFIPVNVKYESFAGANADINSDQLKYVNLNKKSIFFTHRNVFVC